MDQHRRFWPLRTMSRALGVSASGYYAWCKRGPSVRAVANADCLLKIQESHRASHGLYGSPQIHAELRSGGLSCSRGRVERLMRLAGIRGCPPRRFVLTTRPGGAYEPAPNLLARRFAPGAVSALVSDITALETAEGYLYLAVVIELRSRRVIGHSMSSQLHGALGLEALSMALARCPQPPGTLHHSDRGGQYVSHAFQALKNKHQLVASMSRRGDCWDNAVAESFFATLKRELAQYGKVKTRKELMARLFEYIEVFYNRRRQHSSLGYQTPEAYAKLLEESTSSVH
jgi:putative transposase